MFTVKQQSYPHILIIGESKLEAHVPQDFLPKPPHEETTFVNASYCNPSYANGKTQGIMPSKVAHAWQLQL